MENKTKIIISLVLAVILLTGLLTAFNGCTNSAATPAATTKVITNRDGTTITLPADLSRVACLLGPSYERVALLGGEDQVVLAYEQATIWPWSQVVYKNGKTVTMYPGKTAATPNIEDLLKANVQLVVFWNNPEQLKKINEAGIPCIYPANGPVKFDDIKADLAVYAAALGGDASKRLTTYNEYFDKMLKLISSRTAKLTDDQKPTVYFAIRNALQTAGNQSNIPEMVALAGGKCATADLNAGFGQNIVMEQLLEWNPQYIIIDHAGATYLGSAPADQILNNIASDNRFGDLTAVKDKHVYLSPTGVFFWDSGVQQILQMVWLAKMLHPDQFKDIDMVKELKSFYSTFFQYKLTDQQANDILMHLPPQ